MDDEAQLLLNFNYATAMARGEVVPPPVDINPDSWEDVKWNLRAARDAADRL